MIFNARVKPEIIHSRAQRLEGLEPHRRGWLYQGLQAGYGNLFQLFNQIATVHLEEPLNESLKVKFGNMMYALTKNAARESFTDFMEDQDVSPAEWANVQETAVDPIPCADFSDLKDGDVVELVPGPDAPSWYRQGRYRVAFHNACTMTLEPIPE